MSFVVTLDGPAGAGKSSVARQLAKRLSFHHLDTGALYRAVACCLDQNGIAPNESERLLEYLKSMCVRVDENSVFVNGEDVTDLIRSTRADEVVSAYSALKPVREALLGLQRAQANYRNLVTDGRDMGSVVFPEADVKFFLTAAPEARADRRYKELLKKGEAVLYNEILAQIRERDRADMGREIAPLKESGGSIHVDTSFMSEEEVVNQLTAIVRGRIIKG